MTFPEKNGIDCRHFNGYKPCSPGLYCDENCMDRDPFGTRILIINLDAMGDVLMTTAQLPGLKRAYPQSYIVWMTLKNAAPLLNNNPFIDNLVVWNSENRMVLQQQRFDLVLNGDKSIPACAFTASLTASEIRGFTLSTLGQIIPANREAEYNYRMGLDDFLKFRINERTGQEILAETWKLPYESDEYTLILTEDEIDFCASRRKEWNLEGKTIVGFNTGCSELFPNKKMTVTQHIQLISSLADREDLVFLLLGGPEDTARNREIAEGLSHFGKSVISTPTTEGLRRGICYENLADIIVTGDSFGMHLGIGLKKYVLVWFGVSCWAEIDLYGRGEKFYMSDLPCSPCWKRVCPNNLECIAGIDIEAIASCVRLLANSRLRVKEKICE